MIHNILLVDDNDVDNYVSSQLLAQAKLSENIVIKLSAPDALHYLNGLRISEQPFPEIILLDINMPEMNGFEFLDIFSTYPEPLRKSCCIIMLTSSNDPEDKTRIMKTGLVMDYFVKPLTKDKVNKMAEHYDATCKRSNP